VLSSGIATVAAKKENSKLIISYLFFPLIYKAVDILPGSISDQLTPSGLLGRLVLTSGIPSVAEKEGTAD